MKKFNPDVDAPDYKGPYAPYDILKEGTIAFVVIALLAVLLSFVFSSPDEKAISIKSWSTADPTDFVSTALSELNGTSISASYGAPYNTNGDGQALGPLKLEKWAGVRIPVNSANDFVIDPLKTLPYQTALKNALSQWQSASTTQQSQWMTNYGAALPKATVTNDVVTVAATNAGPLPVMLGDLTTMAQSGALDESLITQQTFYSLDYTKPLLFLADSGYINQLAQKQNLLGSQWGMMDETGSWPGQAWLWLYTFWYQISPFSTSANADIMVMATMVLLTALLAAVPFIPGLRSIPRRMKIYRLIWREHYRDSK